MGTARRTVVLLTLLAAAWSPVGARQPARSLELEMEARVAPQTASGPVRLWVPLPAQHEFQSVSDLQVSSPQPWELREDAQGNRFLHVAGDAAVTVTARLRLQVRERRGPVVDGTPEAAARWLEPERLVPRGEPFHSLALGFAPPNARPRARARALYDYVTSTVAYDKSGKGWGRGDARYACDARRGNCTDFHSLLIALAREAGIPARFVIGFPVPREPRGELQGYHCWAELYLADEGWLAVDSSEAAKHPEKRDYYFGSLDPDRVLFTMGRDLVLDPPQDGPPLNYCIYPYAEVDGREAPVAFTLRYADL